MAYTEIQTVRLYKTQIIRLIGGFKIELLSIFTIQVDELSHNYNYHALIFIKDKLHFKCGLIKSNT